jgi:hypothetical protein
MQTKMSFESSHEEALSKERAKTKEDLVMLMILLDIYNLILSRQLKDAEEKLRVVYDASTFIFVHATGAQISSATTTPSRTPTLLSTHTTAVGPEPSPTSIRDYVATTFFTGCPYNSHAAAPNVALKYIDVADANNSLIYQQHLHNLSYIILFTDLSKWILQ